MYDPENEDSEPDHWPLGQVAFHTDDEELLASAKALYAEAWHADSERADCLRGIAGWYVDFAHDLRSIRALPETVRA